MQTHQLTEDIEKIHRNYKLFVDSITEFLIAFFTNYALKSRSIKEKITAEKQIAQSLLLLEKLHMYGFHSFSLYEKYLTSLKCPETKFHYEQFLLLQELIDDHPFIQDEYRNFCKRIISQILSYYPQYSIKIILSPIPEPWKPN